jgi:predicted transcriptional regulator
MSNISLTVDDNLKKKLEQEAVESKTDVEAIILKALKTHVHFREIERLRPLLQQKAKEAGITSEDDIFNAFS